MVKRMVREFTIGTYFYKSPRADGSRYEGEWVNNKINGKGIYKWNDGRVYNGEWLNN